MRTNKKRKICVVTGTRADYGLLFPVMKAIERDPRLKLHVLATGMHLMPKFGYTLDEIKRDGFIVDFKVPMYSNVDTLVAMAKSVGRGIIGITQALEQIKPNVIIVLGDRSEPLAAAIAGAIMNIPIAHIHGGDKSGGGCIDESIRHSITNFTHIHFPATKKHAERIIRMGEERWRVHIVGPLGIYAMCKTEFLSKDQICKELGLNSKEIIIVVIQHPVTTQVEDAPQQMRETLEALLELGKQTVVIYPNADAGGRAMIKVIKKYEYYHFVKILKNLSYLRFISLIRISDVLIGNSSSAIVEAPLFGIPVLNLGIRQRGREKGANVIDLPHKKQEIVNTVKRIISDTKFRSSLRRKFNPYNIRINGAIKIADILSRIKLDNNLLQKDLAY